MAGSTAGRHFAPAFNTDDQRWSVSPVRRRLCTLRLRRSTLGQRGRNSSRACLRSRLMQATGGSSPSLPPDGLSRNTRPVLQIILLSCLFRNCEVRCEGRRIPSGE